MNTVLGLVLIAVGTIMVVKTEWFLSNFGRMSWFEDKFGYSGGSRLGYKIIAVIFIFLGIIFFTGSGTSFMTWLLAPLLRYN